MTANQASSSYNLIHRHRLAALILLAFIILAVGYSLATPPLEAGDESRHYAVVKYMADTGHLPVQQSGEAQIHWSHEGNQPPLYYALAAALTFWIDTDDWNDVFWYNPHTTIGDPLRPDNKNITLHRPDEIWPWRGHVLAVHLSRFLSIIMAAITVITSYAIALNLFKKNTWLAAGAMAFTAFTPMFLFISSAVNNDNAVIMFVTLALWLMTQMANIDVQKSFSLKSGSQVASSRLLPGYYATLFTLPHSSFVIRHSPALLGLLIGLGALSKLYALGLLPLVALLFLWLAYQNNRGSGQRPWRRILLNAALLMLTTILVATVVAGWFYLRNAWLYQGDVLALRMMNEVAGQRKTAFSLSTLWAEFEGFRIAYWALFGGVNILADAWIYRLLDAISLVAVIGLIAFGGLTFLDLRRPVSSPMAQRLKKRAERISRPTFFILLGWCAIMLAGFIVWNLTILALQGRLLYPAIAAISSLLVLGLTWWLPKPVQKIITLICAAALFAFAVIAPLRYIAPAYAKPPILTQADLPADMQPLNLTYDGTMRLLGYQLPVPMVRPSETLPLILYWQVLKPTGLDYSIFIHLLGRQRQVVGQVDTYPGGGSWPTTLLSPGDILADRYEVPIRPEAEFDQAPTRLLIAAGIYDYHEPGRPGKKAVNTAGEPVEPLIASAKLIPWQWPALARLESPVMFGDKAALLSYAIAPDRRSVTLNWQAAAPLESDYTVFLQLWQAGPPGTKGQYVTGFDGPPVQGDYPTSLWQPDEIIIDTHPLDLSAVPAGDYYLLAGLYHPTTGERLPAFAAGRPLPDYAVNLGEIEIRD